MAVKYWDVISKNVNKKGKKKTDEKITFVYLQPPSQQLSGANQGGSIYTGAGPNGIVEPGKPAMMDMTDGRPKMLHEGEVVQPTGNGANVIPANKTSQFMSNTITPTTEEDQYNMSRMEKASGMPGFAAGDSYEYEKPFIDKSLGTYNMNSTGTAQQTTIQPTQTTQAPKLETQKIDTSLANTTLKAPETVSAQPIKSIDTTIPISETLKAPETTTQAQLINPVIPQATNLEPLDNSQIVKPQETLTTVTPPATDTTSTDTAWKDEYLKQLQGLLQSGMDQTMASNLAAQKATAQRGASNPYMTEGAKNAMTAEGERSAGLAASSMASQMANLYNQGIVTAENMQLDRDQFNFAKQQYGDQEGSRIYEDIMHGMTYEQINAKYPNVDMAGYTSMRKAYEQNIESGDLSIAAQRLNLSVADYQSLKDMVNSGATFDDIKAKYPNVTRESYLGMQAASDWGERQYRRDMDSIANLITQGGPENLAAASALFKNKFGQSIDFTRALTAENSSDFNAAWNNMRGLIADNMSWEDALNAMKADGSFDKLNMTEGDVKRMYENQKLQADPMYQTMQMVDTWVAQGWITADESEALQAFIMDKVANPEGLVFEDGIQIKDSFGNEVAFFTDPAKADEFMASNSDKNYSRDDNFKNHIRPSDSAVITGTTGTEPTPSSAHSDGDTWTDKGVNYVMVDGEQKDWAKMSSKDQGDFFKSTVPDDKAEMWTSAKWESKGKPITYDAWRAGLKKAAQDYIDNINSKGWSVPSIIKTPERNENLVGVINNGREKFLAGENIKQYSIEEIKNEWKPGDVRSNISNNDVILFEDYPNPLVVVMNNNPGSATGSSYFLVDLDTGKPVNLKFSNERDSSTIKNVTIS